MKTADTATITGIAAAIFALFGGIVLATTMAWDVSSLGAKISVVSLLLLPPIAIGASFRFLATTGIAAGVVAALCLIAFSVQPFITAFHYLFVGPSIGGLIGGVGAAIMLAQFLIAGLAFGSGMTLGAMLAKKRPNHTPQPPRSAGG